MFRQVAKYAVIAHQQVVKNSLKTALLAFLLALLLARFDLQTLRDVAFRLVVISIYEFVMSSHSHDIETESEQPGRAECA